MKNTSFCPRKETPNDKEREGREGREKEVIATQKGEPESDGKGGETKRGREEKKEGRKGGALRR